MELTQQNMRDHIRPDVDIWVCALWWKDMSNAAPERHLKPTRCRTEVDKQYNWDRISQYGKRGTLLQGKILYHSGLQYGLFLSMFDTQPECEAFYMKRCEEISADLSKYRERMIKRIGEDLVTVDNWHAVVQNGF